MKPSNTDVLGADSPGIFSDCPDWGNGGQFVLDQATGARVRVSNANEQKTVVTGDAVVDTSMATIDLSTAALEVTPTNKKERNRG